MPSPLADFLAQAQSGQEMSQESLFPVTLKFAGQGNPGGYAASTGPLARSMFTDAQGVLMEHREKAFRLRRELFANDGVELVAQKTTLTADGRGYLLNRIVDRPADPCVYLACSEL